VLTCARALLLIEVVSAHRPQRTLKLQIHISLIDLYEFVHTTSSTPSDLQPFFVNSARRHRFCPTPSANERAKVLHSQPPTHT